MSVWLNRIGTAVPPHEVHGTFLRFACDLLPRPAEQAVFSRLASRSGIATRHSVLPPAEEGERRVDRDGFYSLDADFPTTAARMGRYAAEAPGLAARAVADLNLEPAELAGITHLLVASCTGFTAPGLDCEILRLCGLPRHLPRCVIGFMGCQAGIIALRQAWQIVRGDPDARVLVVACELCTLHLQRRTDIAQLLCFLHFADGAAAALVSGAPEGFRLDGFATFLAPEEAELITWGIGDDGFDMGLSTALPARLGKLLPQAATHLLGPELPSLWAVHPGGRAVLEAVSTSLALPQGALAASHAVLHDHGNMSSPSVLFALRALMADSAPGQSGAALAFGPGLAAESLRFTS